MVVYHEDVEEVDRVIGEIERGIEDRRKQKGKNVAFQEQASRKALKKKAARLALGKILRENNPEIVCIAVPMMELQKLPRLFFNKNGFNVDFIHNERLEKVPNLWVVWRRGWDKLHQIAVGIAQELEYLHGGCNTHILHSDIKPHNILLEEDFCPKISNCGLAKLCSRKDSIVSMAIARGRVGYIEPKVFSQNFGAVSHKSDVYNYGMMVLEMIKGRRKSKKYGFSGFMVHAVGSSKSTTSEHSGGYVERKR
ncbi:PR5-like receptor kinase [Macadamia integrifolia]|uniref:PR5-like receptor kinase n=1 Tax=Macadamia integrifolia TaxID=60698 RepID=UPI001C500D88|nr:PR5-like receptor kinase [Macadamia integrifolia]